MLKGPGEPMENVTGQIMPACRFGPAHARSRGTPEWSAGKSGQYRGDGVQAIDTTPATMAGPAMPPANAAVSAQEVAER